MSAKSNVPPHVELKQRVVALQREGMFWQGITLHAKLEPRARVAATNPKRRPGDERRGEPAEERAPRRGAEKLEFVEKVRPDGNKKRVARMSGSRPLGRHVGPQLSAAQRSKLRAEFEKQREAADPRSKKAMELRFRVLLLDRGDYVGGVNPKTMNCRNDGNVYNYARHYCKFYEAGVARSEDALVWANRPAALRVARANASAAAMRQRVGGVAYENLPRAKQVSLIERLACTLMHGFDDFVKCIDAERQAAASQQAAPRSPSYDR